MATETEIITISTWQDRPYEVQYLEHGWRWVTASRWVKKSSAIYAAEELSQRPGMDSTRVVKINYEEKPERYGKAAMADEGDWYGSH